VLKKAAAADSSVVRVFACCAKLSITSKRAAIYVVNFIFAAIQSFALLEIKFGYIPWSVYWKDSMISSKFTMNIKSPCKK